VSSLAEEQDRRPDCDHTLVAQAAKNMRPMPATPTALLSYLLGSWTLTKTLTYSRGGRSGTWSGEATFAPLADTLQVLAYEETGIATLEPSMETFEARHALLYDCSADDRVEVFFDEATKRDDPVDIMAGKRFFHSIDLSSPERPFKHPCGPDMYYGRLLCTSSDLFVLDWRVEGPRKLGRVVSRFRRVGASNEAT
jgi:hypothetical protein